MLKLTDIHSVSLGCQISDGAVVLTHGGAPLEDGALAIPLKEQQETIIAVHDFEQDGQRFRVNAFTKRDDGTLASWERTDEGVRSPALCHDGGEQTTVVRAMVTATSYAPAGAFTARELEGFEQKSSYTPADVDVHLPPPEDEKPGT